MEIYQIKMLTAQQFTIDLANIIKTIKQELSKVNKRDPLITELANYAKGEQKTAPKIRAKLAKVALQGAFKDHSQHQINQNCMKKLDILFTDNSNEYFNRQVRLLNIINNRLMPDTSDSFEIKNLLNDIKKYLVVYCEIAYAQVKISTAKNTNAFGQLYNHFAEKTTISNYLNKTYDACPEAKINDSTIDTWNIENFEIGPLSFDSDDKTQSHSSRSRCLIM